MATANNRRLEMDVSHDQASSSCSTQNKTEGRPKSIANDINHIGSSLDSLNGDIMSHQWLATREFEGRVRHVYDSVLTDINEIRLKVNSLGDIVAGQNKFKTWIPASPFRREILENVSEITGSPMCQFDESVFTVNSECRQPGVTAKYARVRCLRSSSAGALCRSRSQVNSSVSGYGCCFRGHPQNISANPADASRNSLRHFWGPNFTRSRPMTNAAEANGNDNNNNSHDDNSNNNSSTDDVTRNGCLRGDVTDDWRVKVAPYMWDGWDIPGLGTRDRDQAQSRLTRFEELRDEILHAHNVHRGAHGCRALTASPGLTRDAQLWADTLATKGYAQYSEMAGRGENILVIDVGDDISGQEVVAAWYREGRAYNFHQPKWQRGARNFSQLIWRSTRTMGVGLAKVPGAARYMVVVQYRPPGNSNRPGDFANNIRPPRGDSDHCTRTDTS